MASKDMTRILYDGAIRLDYKDKSHYYGVRERIDWDLSVEDMKAWGKNKRPKGTTTLLGDTLEKKGLMTWPMGVALQELFGFYNFQVQATDDNNQPLWDEKGNPVMVRRLGFSKDKGTLWQSESRTLNPYDEELLLPVVKSASENYIRKQKKGADIGSVVHEAIENHVLANPNRLEPSFIEKKVPLLDKDGKNILDEDGDETFETIFEAELDKDGNPIMALPELRPSGFDIQEAYMWGIKDSEYETEADQDKALEDFKEDTEKAELAFSKFVEWWNTERPELVGAEELVYSRENHISGTFDGLIRWRGKLILMDWKTSNASNSKDAAMPEGINYQYFIQDSIYAIAWNEMGNEMPDDVGVVSCRKDGGFTVILASDLGLSLEDCLEWADSVIFAYKIMDKTKRALVAHAEDKDE